MAPSRLTYLRNSLAYLIGRFVLNLRYMTARSKEYGLTLRFRTPDGGGREIYKTGSYEEGITNYFLSKLSFEPGDVILDVGANIGWYTNLFATNFPDTEIHCFEPDPENYGILRENVERNGSRNVVANNCGLGQRSGTTKLYLYKDSNHGRHSMLNINAGPAIDVPITSFDEYVKERGINLRKVRFLKIDIEGFEYAAFLGGREFLRHVPIIMAEFSPGYMRQGGVDPADLLKLLRSYEFEPFVMRGLELDPIDDGALLERNTNINLLWKKTTGQPSSPQ